MSRRLCLHDLPELAGLNLPGYTVVANTVTADELLTAARSVDVEAVVIDLDTPNALGTIVKLAEVAPQAAIVGVTSGHDVQRLILAQRAGCRQVTSRPVERNDLHTALNRALGDASAGLALGRTFSVLGSIGGAGSTTIAAYLAVEIAQLTKEAVAAFDFDLECGTLADVFDQECPYSLADLASAGVVDAGVLEKAAQILSSGVRVFGRPATIAQAHTFDETVVAAVLGGAQRTYPYLVIDLPRQFSPATGTVIEQSTKVILVVQLTVASVRSARHMLTTLVTSGVPSERIEVVVNRFRKRVNACSLQVVEEELQRSALAVIPNDFNSVHAALTSGNPMERKSPVRMAIREIAGRLTGQTETKRESWLGSLTS